MSYTGFLIGNKHTYNDWGLRCYDYKITLPKKQKNLLQIPGRNGKVDTSWEEQSGAYEHRTIKIYCDAPDRNYASWANLVSDIANNVQDEYLSITPDFDSRYYYRGWVTIEPSKDFKVGSDIIFEVDAEPFKLKKDPTTIVRNVSGSDTLILHNDKKIVQPKIITDEADVMITIGENQYTYKTAGAYARAGFYLPAGDTEVTITGTATVTIEYQEGKL